MTKEVPYDELDPGIRQVVRWLNENGFETTDSGDGKSKFAEDGSTMCCAIPFPNVAIRVSRENLISECDRLVALLSQRGLAPQPAKEEEVPGEVNLQAFYEPASIPDDQGRMDGYMMLSGLDDEGFSRGATAP